MTDLPAHRGHPSKYKANSARPGDERIM